MNTQRKMGVMYIVVVLTALIIVMLSKVVY